LNDGLQEYKQYSGIIHVHSTYSDGSLSIPKIARIANELDIDFLLFTDHNTLQPLYDGMEGWYDRILVGVGCELNDSRNMNHYLAFDINEEVSSEVPPNEYMAEVKKQGGFGIIAHPDEKRNAMPEYPPYPWTLWDSETFDGIEIWNQMSEWMEGLTPRNKYWRAMHPRRSILAPTDETLRKWDRINENRRVFGIGGVDAHAHIYRLWGFLRYRIFRYKVIFRTIRTHILTRRELIVGSDHRHNLETVYNTLKTANCFVSNRYVGDATTFRSWVDNGKRSVIMGDEIEFLKGTRLHARLPRKASVRLIRNGELKAEKVGETITFNITEPGVYRIEVHKKKRPWIYTNHFRII
jgi:hypothetical protein